jgi:hypothetical protein
MFSLWFNTIIFHERKISLPLINKASMATSGDQAQEGYVVRPESSILHLHKALKCCSSMPMLTVADPEKIFRRGWTKHRAKPA